MCLSQRSSYKNQSTPGASRFDFAQCQGIAKPTIFSSRRGRSTRGYVSPDPPQPGLMPSNQADDDLVGNVSDPRRSQSKVRSLAATESSVSIDGKSVAPSLVCTFNCDVRSPPLEVR
jgi:hypothetical protein